MSDICYRATDNCSETNVYTLAIFDRVDRYQDKNIFIKAGIDVLIASIDSDSGLSHNSVDSFFINKELEHS